MELSVVQGHMEYLSDCITAFKNSELGEVYYHSDDFLQFRFTEGFTNGEIFVAVDENKRCLGYIWILLNGAFGFPYCTSFAVKKEYRGRGVGTALLKYYETVGFKQSSKLFILVSDFNIRAKKLYESLGYKLVGCIPSLFKDGVSEQILVKFGSEDDIA